jgi:hypothetical protein
MTHEPARHVLRDVLPAAEPVQDARGLRSRGTTVRIHAGETSAASSDRGPASNL